MIRWAIRISQYSIDLKHRSGKQHIDADHLSRIPQGQSKEPVMKIGAINELVGNLEITITETEGVTVSIIMERQGTQEYSGKSSEFMTSQHLN